MICKTDGIVIHSLKYGETSIIARIFTRELGMQSYLVRGVRKAKSKTKQLLFQPLTLVSMVAYHKEKDGLQNIKEINLKETFQSIPHDIQKTSLAIFLAEIFSYALKNQESNSRLFDFLHDTLLYLDQTNGRIADFHLVVLLQMSRFLGFQPRNNHSRRNPYFNLREGLYQPLVEDATLCLDKELSSAFHNISVTELRGLDKLRIPKTQRKDLLSKTIDYYRHHVAGMPEVKSQAVLEMVFSP